MRLDAMTLLTLFCKPYFVRDANICSKGHLSIGQFHICHIVADMGLNNRVRSTKCISGFAFLTLAQHFMIDTRHTSSQAQCKNIVCQ